MNHINATGVKSIKLQALHVTARTEMVTNSKNLSQVKETDSKYHPTVSHITQHCDIHISLFLGF